MKPLPVPRVSLGVVSSDESAMGFGGLRVLRWLAGSVGSGLVRARRSSRLAVVCVRDCAYLWVGMVVRDAYEVRLCAPCVRVSRVSSVLVVSHLPPVSFF